MNRALIENLKIFEEFVQSEEWVQLNRIRSESRVVDEFLSDIMLMFDTVEFFTEIDPQRAEFESNLLSSNM